MEVDEIIRLLNQDFVREIEATMIYVRNAFIIPQCYPSRVTEAIAVDEMTMTAVPAATFVGKREIPNIMYPMWAMLE